MYKAINRGRSRIQRARRRLEASMRAIAPVLLILLLPPVALAQDSAPAAAPAQQEQPQAAPAPANPLSDHGKMVYGYVKMILISSAEKMPEENYSFKPVDTVRTYGQIIGHVADSQYAMCASARGEANPGLKIEQTKTTKADLVAALKQACEYCDKAYNDLTDASAAETLKLGNREMPRLGLLHVNSIHSIEHYGNLITYMRMKNIVPPTSEPGFGQPPKK